MKKQLLSLAMAALVATGAQAQTPLTLKANPLSQLDIETITVSDATTGQSLRHQQAPASRADQTYELSLAYDLRSFLGFGKAGDFAYAMEITADNATFYEGCKVTSINFYSGLSASNEALNPVTDYTVFITERLDAEPVYTQDCEASTVAEDLNYIELDEPYTIEAGKRFFIGVSYTVNAKDANTYTVPIDYTGHRDNAGGWVYGPLTNGQIGWSNIAEQYGFVCISATLEGTFKKNAATSVTMQTVPNVKANEPFSFVLLAENRGTDPASDIEVTYQIGQAPEATAHLTLQEPVEQNGYIYAEVGNLISVLGPQNALKARISKVNGVANETVDNGTMTYFTCTPEGWDKKRKVVIEEFSGTWCQYCPRGIVAMEEIEEKYTDLTLIPLAYHYGDEMFNTGDPISTNVVETYATGFPSAIANRRFDVDLAPGIADVTETYDYFRSFDALASLSAVASIDGNNINIETKTIFALNISDTKNYELSYIVTENNVGPYNQVNGFSGGKDVMGGWEKKGQSVPTVYNDVVRLTQIPNKVYPESVTGGKEYFHTATIAVPTKIVDNYQKDQPVDIDNTCITVLLVNKSTGWIENATRIDFNNSSIEDVTTGLTEADVTVAAGFGTITVAGNVTEGAVYTITGQLAATFNGPATIELPAGIYVVRAGETTAKVAVK